MAMPWKPNKKKDDEKDDTKKKKDDRADDTKKKGRWAREIGTWEWLKNHRKGIHHQMEMGEQASWEAEQEVYMAESAYKNNPSARHSADVDIAINKLEVAKKQFELPIRKVEAAEQKWHCAAGRTPGPTCS